MPVTVRLNVPVVVELHETVEIPDPVTLLGVIAPQVRPVGTASVRDTTPENPFIAVTVIVERADAPTLTAVGEEAEIAKSWKLNVAVAE